MTATTTSAYISYKHNKIAVKNITRIQEKGICIQCFYDHSVSEIKTAETTTTAATTTGSKGHIS
jgi:hypothetical protein